MKLNFLFFLNILIFKVYSIQESILILALQKVKKLIYFLCQLKKYL